MLSRKVPQASASQVIQCDEEVSALRSGKVLRASSDTRKAACRIQPYRARSPGVTKTKLVKEDSHVNDEEVSTEVSLAKSVSLKNLTRRQSLSWKSDLAARTTDDKVPKPTKKKRLPISKTDRQRGRSRTVINNRTETRVPATSKQTESEPIVKRKIEIIKLKHQVNALRNHLSVLKVLLSQLSVDLNQEEPTPANSTIAPIRNINFSPELIEYALRLAYLDLFQPMRSVSTNIKWLEGVETVGVHVFRYGLVDKGALLESPGVHRCLKLLAYIAKEVPQILELLCKLSEATIEWKLPSVSDPHRQHIAWHITRLCKHCPGSAGKVLTQVVTKFCSMLEKLQQNPENYPSLRSETFTYSSIILDILLDFPGGCTHILEKVAQKLKNVPACTFLLNVVKDDILDHVEFKLQPYS